MRDQWNLRLLGGWRLYRGSTPVELAPSPQHLVALLALTGRPSRGYIAGILWPDEPESHGLNNLRALLSRLRQRRMKHVASLLTCSAG